MLLWSLAQLRDAVGEAQQRKAEVRCRLSLSFLRDAAPPSERTQ
jgi:hypothetical protein